MNVVVIHMGAQGCRQESLPLWPHWQAPVWSSLLQHLEIGSESLGHLSNPPPAMDVLGGFGSDFPGLGLASRLVSAANRGLECAASLIIAGKTTSQSVIPGARRAHISTHLGAARKPAPNGHEAFACMERRWSRRQNIAPVFWRGFGGVCSLNRRAPIENRVGRSKAEDPGLLFVHLTHLRSMSED